MDLAGKPRLSRWNQAAAQIVLSEFKDATDLVDFNALPQFDDNDALEKVITKAIFKFFEHACRVYKEGEAGRRIRNARNRRNAKRSRVSQIFFPY